MNKSWSISCVLQTLFKDLGLNQSLTCPYSSSKFEFAAVFSPNLILSLGLGGNDVVMLACRVLEFSLNNLVRSKNKSWSLGRWEWLGKVW
jgi:hypothetical protein